MSEETKFDEILEIYSKPEEHEYVPLGCGHICQVPSVIRDQCCQCSNAKRMCNHCKSKEHKHTLEAKRFYCHKHDVPIGMDKYGNCCVCNYKTTTSSKTTFKELKIYQKSPWLKAMKDAKVVPNQATCRIESLRKRRAMWKQSFPGCKCNFNHIINAIKAQPVTKWCSADHEQKCPFGPQCINACVKRMDNNQKRQLLKKPGVTTLHTIHEFVGLATDNDMTKRNTWGNSNIAHERQYNSSSTLDEKKSDDNDVFDRNAITWPSLAQVDKGERSIHEWFIFEKKNCTNWETDSDSYSLISEPFSDSCWVDLAPAKKKENISFAEILKRKSKNNFDNRLANVKQINTFTYKHETKTDEPDAAEVEYIVEKMKGTHRNHATKNSRKGAAGRVRKLGGRVRGKRSKHSVRRQCL